MSQRSGDRSPSSSSSPSLLSSDDDTRRPNKRNGTTPASANGVSSSSDIGLAAPKIEIDLLATSLSELPMGASPAASRKAARRSSPADQRLGPQTYTDGSGSDDDDSVFSEDVSDCRNCLSPRPAEDSDDALSLSDDEALGDSDQCRPPVVLTVSGATPSPAGTPAGNGVAAGARHPGPIVDGLGHTRAGTPGPAAGPQLFAGTGAATEADRRASSMYLARELPRIDDVRRVLEMDIASRAGLAATPPAAAAAAHSKLAGETVTPLPSPIPSPPDSTQTPVVPPLNPASSNRPGGPLHHPRAESPPTLLASLESNCSTLSLASSGSSSSIGAEGELTWEGDDGAGTDADGYTDPESFTAADIDELLSMGRPVGDGADEIAVLEANTFANVAISNVTSGALSVEGGLAVPGIAGLALPLGDRFIPQEVNGILRRPRSASSKSGRSCVFSQVFAVGLADGSSLRIQTRTATSVREVLRSICTELGLVQREYFGLLEFTEDGYEEWLQPSMSLMRQVKAARPLLRFQCKLYPAAIEDVTDPLTLRLLTAQVHEILCHDGFGSEVTKTTAISMAALQLQALFGNYDAEIHKPAFFRAPLELSTLLPRKLLSSSYAKLWSKRVLEAYAVLDGLSRADAQRAYLEMAASEFESFGTEYFHAKDAGGRRDISLAISPRGLVLYSKKGVATRYSFASLHRVVLESAGHPRAKVYRVRCLRDNAAEPVCLLTTSNSTDAELVVSFMQGYCHLYRNRARFASRSQAGVTRTLSVDGIFSSIEARNFSSKSIDAQELSHARARALLEADADGDLDIDSDDDACNDANAHRELAAEATAAMPTTGVPRPRGVVSPDVGGGGGSSSGGSLSSSAATPTPGHPAPLNVAAIAAEAAMAADGATATFSSSPKASSPTNSLARRKTRVDELIGARGLVRQDSLDGARGSGASALTQGLEHVVFSLEDGAYAKSVFVIPGTKVAHAYAQYCRGQAHPDAFEVAFMARGLGCRGRDGEWQSEGAAELWLEPDEPLVDQIREHLADIDADDGAEGGSGGMVGLGAAATAAAAAVGVATSIPVPAGGPAPAAALRKPIHVVCRVALVAGVVLSALKEPARLARHALFLHARRQFLTGSLSARRDETALVGLVALLLQHERGDCLALTVEGFADNITAALPPAEPSPPAGALSDADGALLSIERRRRIYAEYRKLAGTSATDAEDQYLALAAERPGFGAFVFDVSVEDQSGDGPFAAALAVDISGNVHFTSAARGEVVHAAEEVAYWSVAAAQTVELEIGERIVTVRCATEVDAQWLATVMSKSQERLGRVE